MRHTYGACVHAVGTVLAVRQKLMLYANIRTTMNPYGDVVTDETRKWLDLRLAGPTDRRCNQVGE
jgi:hypothetical protein